MLASLITDNDAKLNVGIFSCLQMNTFPGEGRSDRSQLAEALGVADKGFQSIKAGAVDKPTSAV